MVIINSSKIINFVNMDFLINKNVPIEIIAAISR